MLIEKQDVEAHLDSLLKLEPNDMYMFKVTSFNITSFQAKDIFVKIEKKILDGDKQNTVIIIEEPPHRWGKETEKDIKILGSKIDETKEHNIHAFFVPSSFFQDVIDETRHWD